MAEIKSKRCNDWPDFKRTLYPVLFGHDRFVDGAYLFRGVGDESWHLVSAFDRLSSAIPLGDRQQAAQDLLQMFVEECASDAAIEACPEAQEERIALAQHHGLPTRALDWTESPYIAAFFALAGQPTTSGARTSANVAIWALDVGHTAWNGSTGAEILRPERRENERLLRQRGAFTYLRAPQESLDAYVEACPDRGVALHKFTLPRADAKVALADLGAMGISATRLFPDHTGAARGALARYARRAAGA